MSLANHLRVEAASRAMSLTSYLHTTELHLPGAPDEVSLLFASPEELEEFRLWAIGEGGMENFARVEWDFAVCIGADWWEPVVSETALPVRPVDSFAVRFEFLRVAGAPWRIEAMCILSGDAPLHTAWLEMYGSGCVVHVSYKLPSRDAYDQHTRRGPYASQWPDQPTFRAAYGNSYGRFAYYQHANLEDSMVGSSWFLKPRVNERDAR